MQHLTFPGGLRERSQNFGSARPEMTLSLPTTSVHMYRHRGLLILIASCFVCFTVAAVDFKQCLTNIQKSPMGSTGGLDNRGNPIANISAATAITYQLCVSACGEGPEAFEWSLFAQRFGAWLLPWLALISQLPFGARLKSENLVSMLLAVGSPTLAAYSLALTVLNGQWIARRFAKYAYPNTRHAVRVLSSLQQAPLVITKDGLLESLVVLPENDDWWQELDDQLHYTHTWSISAITSIGWVIIAYLFTVIVSFTDIIDNIQSNGQSVGTLWLWLLPIVVGWLQISPKCDSDKLRDAMTKANSIAYVATDTPGAPDRASTQSMHRGFSLRLGTVYPDEECSAPIYNYARFFPWVHAVAEVSSAFRYASKNAGENRPVDEHVEWKDSARGVGINNVNRVGSHRQVTTYCRPPEYVRRSHWGPDVLSTSLIAALLSLLLQWGTTGAAVIVVWFTPTKGKLLQPHFFP